MKQEKWEELLSRSIDGDVSRDEQAALDAELARNADLRTLRDAYLDAGRMLRELPVIGAPTPEVMWSDVQRELRKQRAEEAGEAPVFAWRLRWAGAIVAAVLLGVTAIYVLQQRHAAAVASVSEKGGATVEFVEASDPNSSTMVYEDAETGWTVIWVASTDTEAEGSGS